MESVQEIYEYSFLHTGIQNYSNAAQFRQYYIDITENAPEFLRTFTPDIYFDVNFLSFYRHSC